MIISVCGSMRVSLTTCSTLDLTRHRTTIRASWCQCHKTFFASSPTLQRNKLEHLSLFSLSRIIMQRLRFTLRHPSIIDSLSFVRCLLLAPLIIGFFFLLRLFTVLMKQTRQVVRVVKQSIFLRCLWVYLAQQLSALPTNIRLG
jgi:hypothetical protein